MSFRRMLIMMGVLVGLTVTPTSALALNFPLAPGAPLTAGGEPATAFAQMTVADFNGDGLDDIAASTSDAGIFVWASDGDGTFTLSPGAPFATAINARPIHSGDFDGDGDIDLLTGSNTSPVTFRTYLNDGSGGFSSTADRSFQINADAEVPYFGTSMGDLNDDGRLDLVVGQFNRRYSVALGNADGSFSVTPQSPIPLSVSGSTDYSQYDSVGPNVIGDFNDDGDADIAMAVQMNAFNDPREGVYVVNGAGDGTFTAAADNPRISTRVVRSVAKGDFNSDGIDDLSAAIASYTNNVVTLLGGPGSLSSGGPKGTFTTGASFPHIQTVDDFDSDGKDDIAATESYRVFMASGDGTDAFSPTPGFPLAIPDIGTHEPDATDLKSGDFNGDGYRDLVAMSGFPFDTTWARGIYPYISSPSATAPPTHDFGEVLDGGTLLQAVAVKNAGGPPVTFDDPRFTVSGPNADEFHPQAGFCDVTIVANDPCQVGVQFSPVGQGAKSATITFHFTNADDVTVDLEGTSIHPGFTVAPDHLDFGSVDMNSVTASQSVTITSTGSSPLHFAGDPLGLGFPSSYISGTGGGQFEIASDTCVGPYYFDAGETCVFSIRATAKKPGTFTANLHLDPFGAPTNVPLSVKVIDTTPPPPPDTPQLSMKLKLPKKVKAGKAFSARATVTNFGTAASNAIQLKSYLSGKLAIKPAAVQVPALSAGGSVTRSIPVKVRKNARKGKALRVIVVATSPGVSATSASGISKIR